MALALRLFYVFDARPALPIRGDINEYVLYAWNLQTAGTFSSELPSGKEVTPDSYRGPGYPFVLAMAMRLSGNAALHLREVGRGRYDLVADPSTWMMIAQSFQALCGAVGVLLCILLARFWLAPTVALSVGFAAALWPHAIVFAGTLLSETVFGITLLIAMLLLAHAERSFRASLILAASSGLAFGAAWLVNPIIALFPAVAAAWFALNGRRATAIALVLAYAVAPIAWSIRNATLPQESRGSALVRVEQNFVQGSWPSFLIALATRSDPISKEVIAGEAEEEQRFLADPKAGLRAMVARFELEPAAYLHWYLLRKPYLLWDWNLLVGWGDIYFLETPQSPFEHVPLLQALRNGYATVNPIVFALALAALILGAIMRLRQHRLPFAFTATAWLVLYVSFVHTILQAEPRYSIPYRPFELLLAASACSWLFGRVRRGAVPTAANVP